MTKIEYADETYNPFAGCSPCSPGCACCYAARAACGRFLKDHPLYEGLAVNNAWTGEVRLCTDIGREDILEKPLHWKQPRTIFVGNVGDLFHPKVPFEFVERIWDVFFEAPQHKYLVLTKRPHLMWQFWEWMRTIRYRRSDYPNVWPGTTICNQAEADEKIPILLQIPAAKRWLSIEPILGPIDFGHIISEPQLYGFACDCNAAGVDFVGDKFPERRGRGGPKDLNDPGWDTCCTKCGCSDNRMNIDQVVLGCESGPNRRPCDIDWMIDVVEQCEAVGLPVFVKQVSLPKIRALREVRSDIPGEPIRVLQGKIYKTIMNDYGAISAITKKGILGLKPDEFDIIGTYVSHNPDEWPAKRRVREKIN